MLNRKKTLKQKILLLSIGSLLAFVTGEIIVRTCVTFPVEREHMRFSSIGFKRIPIKMRDDLLFWKADTQVANYTKERAHVFLRVLCLGDSITQSYTHDGKLLPVEQTYEFILKGLLSERFLGEHIEVINAGNGGFTSLQGLHYLENRLLEYKPDLVISWFGNNDNAAAAFYEDKQQKWPKEQNFRPKSKLLLFFKNYKRFTAEVLSFAKLRVSADDYYENCAKMYELAQNNDFEIVFIAPYKVDRISNGLANTSNFLKLREVLEKLGNDSGCKIIDLSYALLNENTMLFKELFVDDNHPTSQGNEFIAGVFYDELQYFWEKLESQN